MDRKWELKEVDELVVLEAAESSRLPPPLARVMALRGHHAPDAVRAFLNPRLSNLSDPFLLPDLEKAADRIWAAVDRQEAVTVFGDYDVDGVTASALLVRLLGALGAKVRGFIPDRMDEGYGLSEDALERCIQENGTSVLITVDCGTNSCESVTRAKSLGIDVIITDHHEPDRRTAPAYALINPKLADARTIGLQDLSGVGLAFKFAHALLKTGRAQGRAKAAQIKLDRYLDLVALGTVADLVPLTGENRILVRHGLDVMEQTDWPGLKALKAAAGIQGRADTFQIGFQLGPRINAAGRIGQPMQALRLLTTDEPAEAREIAMRLNRTNQERRRLEREMADEVIDEIDGYFDPLKNFGLVVARPGWHPGVVGIVASRVVRRYNRPAIVMGIHDDGGARGSCRSIEEFNVLEGLRDCEALLTKYGGHEMAAGVELPAGAIDRFRQAFNAASASVLKTLDLVPVRRIDAVLEADLITDGFFDKLSRLEPFGQDNPEPVWALRGVQVSGAPRVVGEDHLKLSIAARGRIFEAIAFNFPPDCLPAGPLDLAFILKQNHWNGRSRLQLQIKEMRAARAPDSEAF
jgi:single-stranded-DNA-specific exonuclease